MVANDHCGLAVGSAQRAAGLRLMGQILTTLQAVGNGCTHVYAHQRRETGPVPAAGRILYLGIRTTDAVAVPQTRAKPLYPEQSMHQRSLYHIIASLLQEYPNKESTQQDLLDTRMICKRHRV
jgi:hypothetical protein